jgi:hypothetical protein
MKLPVLSDYQIFDLFMRFVAIGLGVAWFVGIGIALLEFRPDLVNWFDLAVSIVVFSLAIAILLLVVWGAKRFVHHMLMRRKAIALKRAQA